MLTTASTRLPGREIGRQLRHFIRQPAFDALRYRHSCRCVPGVEPDLDEAGMHRGIGGVDGGEAIIHADVVDDDTQVGG